MTMPVSDEMISRFGENHVPHFNEMMADEPEKVQASLQKLLGNSYLGLVEAHGFDWKPLEKDTFYSWALSPTRTLNDELIDEEKWKELMAFSPELQLDFLSTWHEFIYNEAFAVFSVDYEVKRLSQFTAGRFTAFVEAWGGLAKPHLQQVFQGLLELAQEDNGLALEWQLPMVLGEWPGRIEVPYVEPKRDVEEEAEAVVSGANGKKMKI